MLKPGLLAFVVLSINPFGGLLISIPLAVLGLHYPVWFVLGLGIPLAYVQVIAVDAGWSLLTTIPWWSGLVTRLRSGRVERLAAARGAFWVTMILSPIIGPWLAMAVLRYAQVPHRRVALPLFLGLCWNATAIALACLFVPRLFRV